MWMILLFGLCAGTIGIAAVLKSSRRQRDAKNLLRNMGLSSEELAQIGRHLSKDEQAAGENLIACAQARGKAALRAAGLDLDAMTPVIGEHIRWVDVVEQVFRVKEFDRSDTTIGEDGKVHAQSTTRPYGFLLVESPIFNQKVRLPIIHREDFALAASAFDEPELAGLLDHDELLVTYRPKHKLPAGMAGLMHALHYVIVPRGTLERYYEAGNGLHMRKPALEKLFESFEYELPLWVDTNNNPQV
jgi:hypothetical protein